MLAAGCSSLHKAMDTSKNEKIRQSVALIFEGIYALALQCGADIQAIRSHEAAIVMVILNDRRKQCLRPVTD